MQEFEPKLNKSKVFTREFFSKYIYIFVIALCLLLGVSYSLTFFVQNKNISTGSITVQGLSITASDSSINATGLTVPLTDAEGLQSSFSKSITISNSSNVDGKINVRLTRTSGLELTDMRYALIINGAIQEIGDVPSNGKMLTTAIMSNETINVEIRLWPKTSYSGSTQTFVGELVVDEFYFGDKASNMSDPEGKYVKFNCSGNNCETWRIVGVEDGRLVLTRQADYEGATQREDSHHYYAGLSFNDDSLITSVSSDNDHKNVYLLRTVKITGGSGTLADPYTLGNSVDCEADKKVLTEIIYTNVSNVEIGIQKIYYGQSNYISQTYEPFFVGWEDTNSNTYLLGDSVSFTTRTTLVGTRSALSTQILFDNTVTGFSCTEVHCALDALYQYRH